VHPVDLDAARPGDPPPDDRLLVDEAPEAVVARRMRAHDRIWVVGYGNDTWGLGTDPVRAVAPRVLRDYRQVMQWVDGIAVSLWVRRGTPRGYPR
jgi:hypothetical protein